MPSSPRLFGAGPSDLHEILNPKDTTAQPTRPEPTRSAPSRRNDGWIASMKRALAPRPMTTSNSVLGSVTKARPMTARAKLGLGPAEEHKPDPHATTQAAALRHGRNVARTVAGAGKPGAARVAPDLPIVEPGGTEAVSAGLFNHMGVGGGHVMPALIAADLRLYLAPPENASADVAAEAAGRQELVLRRMSQAFGDDAPAARRALDGLVAASTPLAVENGAFELARRLAPTSLGHSALNTLCSLDHPPPDDAPLDAAMRNDAQRLAFTAANTLIDALPDGAQRPASLAEVREIAMAALAPHDRPHGTPSQAPPAPMKGNVNLAAKAFLAALQLAANPKAEPERHLKNAYFSWRCGFREEGPGTPLARAQERMFKLSRYAQRASNPGMLAGLRRAFGFNKSPMSALAMGTGGASLRQPEDDFEKARVIKDLGDALVEQAQARGGAPLSQRISAALKGATLEQWYTRTAHKGWRDQTTVTPAMRQAIAARAAELAGVSVTEVKFNPTYKELKGTRSILRPRGGAQLDVATLRRWIEQCEPDGADDAAPAEGADPAPIDTAALRAGADRLATLEHDGEVPLDTSTPQTVLQNFKRVITEPRMTYDVRLTNGGQFGINFNAAEILNIPVIKHFPVVPFVLAGPDVRLTHSRMAMINGGSSANHGQLFIGSDRRISGHLGATATAGVNVLGKRLSASGTVHALPLVVDTSSPKGVMVRCRFQPIGPAPAGHPDPWRAKLLSVVDAATASGPGGGLPTDVNAMWDALSHAFYKDPDVSLNWLESRGVSVSSSVGVSAGPRVQHDGYKVGPVAQVNAGKTWSTRVRRQETPGPLRAEYASSSSARQLGVAATLVAGPPQQGQFSGETGHVASVSLPSASVVGFSTTILQSEIGSVWRIAEEDGHIDPALTYRDTTFTSMKEMKRYVDSRRADWDAVYPNQPPDSSSPAESIDQYLARVEGDATSGNQLFAERVWLRPDAARQINVLRELRDALVAPGAQPTDEQAAQIAMRNAQISNLLESDRSWDKRFFYSLEVTGQSRAVGANFMVTGQQVSEVSHPHQLSVLRAERPVPPAEQ